MNQQNTPKEPTLADILEEVLTFSAEVRDAAFVVWNIVTGQSSKPVAELCPNTNTRAEDKGPYGVKRTLAVISSRLDAARHALGDVLRVLSAELDDHPLL